MTKKICWEYHSTNPSSKDELNKKSEVMPWAIEKLQTFEEEERLYLLVHLVRFELTLR